MNSFTKEELTILLAYYYFENKKSDNKLLKKFTNHFNDVFNSDFSAQLISYYCSLFKSVDSSYNAKPSDIEDIRIKELWDCYITQDRISDLKQMFLDFKKATKNIENIIVNEDDSDIKFDEAISNLSFTFKGDFPKKKYANDKNEKTNSTVRDLNVSYNALKIAGFKCEANNSHKTFIRKTSPINYTEGHHIIPLKYQDKYDVNLDVEANIVSLCSNCHNQLHYGKDYEGLLGKILTNERLERLNKCGIKITIERLIEMYK